MKKNVKEFKKGLHTDSRDIDSPKGTYKFALNALPETDIDGEKINSNENSNEACFELPLGYVPIGKVYLNDGRTVIFSVSTELGLSEIGIVDNFCNYKTEVNGDLGFKLSNQIDATYRLRKGCEDTIYWVDGDNNPPMYYNFSSPEEFKTSGVFDKDKFSLQTLYSKIPIWEEVKVLDEGGSLTPGSYNIGIQYVDSELNATEVIVTSEVINIYNNLFTDTYREIRGSIKSEEDYLNYGDTNKSIKIVLSNLDTKYLYYRLSFIEATSGTGRISSVKYSQLISINNTTFIYTGANFETTGTKEEISFFNSLISTADSIEQIENRLVLANTTAPDIAYHKLQGYASRIKVDVATKKIFLTSLVENSPKFPTIKFGDKNNINNSYDGGSHYQPGEIYSLGIVYIINNHILSPSFHIPGKNNTLSDDLVFSPDVGVFGMKAENNTNLNTEYQDNGSCPNIDYWGVDSEGISLKNKKVRHHRLPLRSDLNIPLVKIEDTIDTDVLFYRLKLNITGTIVTPCTQEQIDDGECTTLSTALPFQVRVEYVVDGQTEYMTVNINPQYYTTDSNTYQLTLTELSGLYSDSNIVVVNISESQDDGSLFDATNGTQSPKGLVYTTEIVEANFTTEDRVYSSQVMGLKFSGVHFPAPNELGEGYTVTGYYITRQERKKFDKTILDSAVVTPFVTNKKYIANGLLVPEFDDETKISKTVFGLIHPDNKFLGTQYLNYTDIVQQGAFKTVERKKSKIRVRDVSPGSSYDEKHHKFKDEDGWSLKVVSRDNILVYKQIYDTFNKDFSLDVERAFYLNSLESKETDNSTKDITNISGDNITGVLELKEEHSEPILSSLPYVYLRKDIEDSYSNYRTSEYYKVSINPETATETITFNGDTYLSPMRYLNTMFWDNRIAERATKKKVWQIVVGGLLIVTGVLLAFVPGGQLATPALVAAGATVVGLGVLLSVAGIENEAWSKAYQEDYAKGLRETGLDNWTDFEYNYVGRFHDGHQITTPEDDEVQWFADCLTDLWFESQIDISLRYGVTSEATDFLNAPGRVESGNENQEETGKDNVNWSASNDVYLLRDVRLDPYHTIDRYLLAKLTISDKDNLDNKKYIGHCLGEYYKVNPDYMRLNKEKIFFNLGLEYDFCSECAEKFPLRVHASEQSFQEELTDNYRVFLPNNYRDLEGEHGEITDLLRWRENLYVFTEEALWMLPAQYQERVTDEIVSFIGTGDIFSLPARKILDGTHITAGTRHKWATIKEEHGFFYVSEHARKVYMYNGTELKDLTLGNSKWFKSNGGLGLLEEYYNLGGHSFPNLNNPSNRNGIGFIAAYDSYYSRIILTKKDFSLDISSLPESGDFRICLNGTTPVIFYGYQETIDAREEDGWTFKGIENCEMVFEKIIYETTIEQREIVTTINNDADVIFQMDMSGSFTEEGRGQILTAIQTWANNYTTLNPAWIGNVYIHRSSNENASEKSWKTLNYIESGVDLYDINLNPVTPVISQNIVAISIVNENAGQVGNTSGFGYHSGFFPLPMEDGYGDFYVDSVDHKSRYTSLIANGGSFNGLLYPIVFSHYSQIQTNAYLHHIYAALKGTDFTPADIAALVPNTFATYWNDIVASLQTPNLYPDDGMENYGWKGVFDKGWDGVGPVVTPAEFDEDINTFLEAIETRTLEDFTINTPVVVIETVPGVEKEIIKSDKSWTMSYYLKGPYWVGWHSYLPNFYLYVSEKYYSWKNGIVEFWKHNILGKYQEYYNVKYPFIIEYATKSEPLQTKIYDSIMLHTEASRYDSATEEFVEERFKTFNQGIFYNTRQCTGLLNLVAKDTAGDEENYLHNQIINLSPGSIVIDKNEKNWTINDIRDIRIDYDQPIFKSDENSLANLPYIDKILNDSTLDLDKDWTQLESFRDKYLVVRLIFNNFEDIKLVFNYSIEDEEISQR